MLSEVTEVQKDRGHINRSSTGPYWDQVEKCKGCLASTGCEMRPTERRKRERGQEDLPDKLGEGQLSGVGGTWRVRGH